MGNDDVPTCKADMDTSLSNGKNIVKLNDKREMSILTVENKEYGVDIGPNDSTMNRSDKEISVSNSKSYDINLVDQESILRLVPIINLCESSLNETHITDHADITSRKSDMETSTSNNDIKSKENVSESVEPQRSVDISDSEDDIFLETQEDSHVTINIGDREVPSSNIEGSDINSQDREMPLLTRESNDYNGDEFVHRLMPIIDLYELPPNENRANNAAYSTVRNESNREASNCEENSQLQSPVDEFEYEDDIFTEAKEDFEVVYNKCEQFIDSSYSEEFLNNGVENDSVNAILKRPAECETKILEKVLGTSEYLVVYLEQEDLAKLKETYADAARKKKRWHQRSSHQADRFFCNRCRFTASTRYDFLVHQGEAHKDLSKTVLTIPLRYVHPSENPDEVLYKCTDCSYSTCLKWSFDRHLVVHKKLDEVDTFRCALCAFVTKNKSGLAKHMRIHTWGDRADVRKCPYCSFVTQNKSYVPQHIRMVHDVVKVKMWKCPHCDFQSKYQTSLKLHIDTHSTKRKMYKCPYCPFETPYEYVLKQSHRLKHASEEARVFCCAHCDYKSKTKETLSKHLVTHRERNIKWHKCKYCSYKTKHKSYMPRHVLLHEIPEGVRPYACKQCPYLGKTRQHLSSHMKQHLPPDKGTMYRCSECPYQSRNGANVKRHSLVHRKDSEITWVRCKYCEFEAKSEDRMKLHCKNMHEDPSNAKWYACDVCGFRSKSSGNMNRHSLIHSNPDSEQLFRCKHCGKCTKTKKSFERHMARHPENMFKCDQCNYKTVLQVSLKRHKLQRH